MPTPCRILGPFALVLSKFVVYGPSVSKTPSPATTDDHIIAIDAGTTGVRAIAFGHDGNPLASAYREFTQYFPEPGWVEHDATEIWKTTVEVLTDVVAQVGQPTTIGITNQRETAVVWDKRTGLPRHRAIVWQDRRTAATCDAMAEAGHLPLVRSQTGLVLDPYFSASKLQWLITKGGVSDDTDLAFGTVDSWLIWNLTNGAAHVTDTTNASRTALFDITTMAWSPQLLELWGVRPDCLPEVRPSSGHFGDVTAGLPITEGTPITGVAGDQHAALFGQACFALGDAKNTYGTGSFLLMNVGETCPEPVSGLLTTVAWSIEIDGVLRHTYALEGAIFVTGAAVQWLRDGLGIIDQASDLEGLAKQCESSDGVVLVPAFTGLGSPWWDPYARGTITGLTRGSGRPQIARAVIDAMVHQTRDVVDAMTEATGTPLRRLRVDGGASTMNTLLQQQADQLGVQVARPVVQETTALGAAYLAGLAVGFWNSFDDIEANWKIDVVVKPEGDRQALDATHTQWHRGVERSLNWASEQ